MAERIIQSSFNTGEIAPALYARTDVAKYHSACALLRNFFVDYRGGASTRSGTQYIAQTYKQGLPVRLIPFQASATVNYILEFGDKYVRFFNNRQPVVENGVAVTALGTDANGNQTISAPGASYSVGDWIQIQFTNLVGLNGGTFIIASGVNDLYTLTYLDGTPVLAQPGGSAGGGTFRIYTLPTPYAATDLALLKYAQSVNTLIICHPNYPPATLVLNTAVNWSLTPIMFGSNVLAPTSPAVTTSLSSGSCSYSYVVTSVDANGQESPASVPVLLNGTADIRSVNGTNRVTWNTVPAAQRYNIYKADIAYFSTVPVGVPYGYLGTSTGGSFDDSNIAPDFAESPPVLRDIIVGGGIQSVVVTNRGSYSTVPTVTDTGANTTAATLTPVMQIYAIGLVVGGKQYKVGESVIFGGLVTLLVTAVDSQGGIISLSAYTPNSAGNVTTSGQALPLNVGDSYSGGGARINLYWGLGAVQVTTPGTGHTAPGSVTISATSGDTQATASVTLQAQSYGYPSVPGFFQQRLFLGAPAKSPAGFNLSQPGSYYNFNVSLPSQADDSISGTLVANQLNAIKSVVSTSSGLIVFTDKASWLINGGGNGAAVSPSSIVANQQSHTGASDVPPIVSNYDILYVQAKGSIVRDASFNIYANVYTGSDISALSSHLFYGHQILEWAFAEEPFKLIWAVREDGILLSLTFLKEQEFVGWAHSDTSGLFKSVATVPEQVGPATVDAIYTVVQRTINGNAVMYVERLGDRTFNTATDATCVDAYLRYTGAANTSFAGARHLAGAMVTGLADGVVIPPFVMPTSGAFTLAKAASIVTIGLPFTAQLQTLALDTGEPTVQGKMKKITNVTIRVAQTLGLKIGTAFTTLVNMKDTTVGNVGRMSNQVVTDLVSTDVSTYIDPAYTVPGQYCIQQDTPFPATILGVIPQFELGDTDARR